MEAAVKLTKEWTRKANYFANLHFAGGEVEYGQAVRDSYVEGADFTTWAAAFPGTTRLGQQIAEARTTFSAARQC